MDVIADGRIALQPFKMHHPLVKATIALQVWQGRPEIAIIFDGEEGDVSYIAFDADGPRIGFRKKLTDPARQLAAVGGPLRVPDANPDGV